MTSPAEKAEADRQERPLRARAHDALKRLNADTVNEIRRAYYEASDNLSHLAKLLEDADCQLDFEAGPMIELHLKACEVLDSFKGLATIGQIL